MPWLAVLAGLAVLWLLALVAPEPFMPGPAPVPITITVMPEDAGRLTPPAGVITVPAPPFGEGAHT